MLQSQPAPSPRGASLFILGAGGTAVFAPLLQGLGAGGTAPMPGGQLKGDLACDQEKTADSW